MAQARLRVKDVFQRFELPITNMMRIGTDNASVITGQICHSLQLAVSSAAKQFLPRNLEYIISETYNWFSRSASRQAKYKDLYNTINDGKNPLKIVQSSQTRWL